MQFFLNAEGFTALFSWSFKQYFDKGMAVFWGYEGQTMGQKNEMVFKDLGQKGQYSGFSAGWNSKRFYDLCQRILNPSMTYSIHF